MERRTHIRYDFDKEVEYALNPTSSKEIFRGKTIDISDLGLGLYVFYPLSVGQEILLKGEINLNGTIKWCDELGDNIYRVGLQFIL